MGTENQKEKEYLTEKDMLKSGAIVQSYTKTHLFTVKPAFSISRVCFSIVKLNTNGEEFLDYYMTTKDMLDLCKKIDDGTVKEKLKQDKSDYPSAYKYITGDNGSKKLNLGGGQKGPRIQIQIYENNKWNNMMTVVPYKDLEYMTFMYKLVAGLIPCNGYYKELFKVYWDGAKERDELYGNKK